MFLIGPRWLLDVFKPMRFQINSNQFKRVSSELNSKHCCYVHCGTNSKMTERKEIYSIAKRSTILDFLILTHTWEQNVNELNYQRLQKPHLPKEGSTKPGQLKILLKLESMWMTMEMQRQSITSLPDIQYWKGRL